MRSCRSHPIHIRAEIRMSGRRKRTVRDALCIQPKSIFLGIVLPCWEGARDDFALVAVAPALHVLVGIVGSCWFTALEIRVVEDFLGVRGWEAGDDYVAAAVCFVFCFVCHGCLLKWSSMQGRIKYHIKN